MSTELDQMRAELDRAVLPQAAAIRRRGDRRRRRRAVTGGMAVLLVLAAITIGLRTRPDHAHLPVGSSPSPSPTVEPSTHGRVTNFPPPTLASVYPDPLVMDVNGIGPYRIDASLDSLRAGCSDTYDIGVIGRYEGEILLVVKGGQLVEVGTAGGSDPIRSLAGAAVGMSFAQVEALYGKRAVLDTHGQGGLGGVYVTSGDRVLLFSGHPIRPGVGYFAAGLASYTLNAFRTGAAC